MEATEKRIRIGPAFFFRPDYGYKGIKMDATRKEFEGVADVGFGDYTKVQVTARYAVQLGIERLTKLQIGLLNDNGNESSNHVELQKAISTDIAKAAFAAFKIGELVGHEEGKRILERMIYGRYPRSAKVYNFDSCNDVSILAVPEHRVFLIGVKTPGDNDIQHDNYCICIHSHFQSLTSQVFELVNKKAASAVFGEEMGADEWELLDRLDETLNTALIYCYDTGKDTGYECGQTWLKKQYGFYPEDVFIYSFRSSLLNSGILVNKTAIGCHCGNCPACLGCAVEAKYLEK